MHGIFCCKLVFYAIVMACGIVAIVLPFTFKFPPDGSFGGQFNASAGATSSGYGSNKMVTRSGQGLESDSRDSSLYFSNEGTGDVGQEYEPEEYHLGFVRYVQASQVITTNSTNSTLTPEEVLEIFQDVTVAFAAPVVLVFLLAAIAIVCRSRCCYIIMIIFIVLCVLIAGAGAVWNGLIYAGDVALCDALDSQCAECILTSGEDPSSDVGISDCLSQAYAADELCYYTQDGHQTLCSEFPLKLEVIVGMFCAMSVLSFILAILGCCFCAFLEDDLDTPY